MSAPSYAWPAARRVAIGQRLRAKLKEVKAELRQRWHDPIPEVGQWLGSVVRGYYQYHGIAGNARAIVMTRSTSPVR
jgi:RNA-directed DNA polymerase